MKRTGPRVRVTTRMTGAVGVAMIVVAMFGLAACGGGTTTASNSPSVAPSQTAPSPSWSPTMKPAAIPVVNAGEGPPPFAKLAKVFAYDTAEPLDFYEGRIEQYPKCTMQRIGYTSQGEEASAYLVMPEGDGPFPVVIYAPGWRFDADIFLDDAVALAQEGYAGLLIQEPSLGFWSFDPLADCRVVTRYVVQERRGLDLLETLPRIDAKRIAFVGWSNGAHLCGGILAGVDDRIKAYVLLGMARPATNYQGLMSAEEMPKGAARDRMAAQLTTWDPVTYLSHNKSAAVFLVNGRSDTNAMQDAPAFVAAAPKLTTWKVYAGGHGGWESGFKLARPWLQQQLAVE